PIEEHAEWSKEIRCRIDVVPQHGPAALALSPEQIVEVVEPEVVEAPHVDDIGQQKRVHADRNDANAANVHAGQAARDGVTVVYGVNTIFPNAARSSISS